MLFTHHHPDHTLNAALFPNADVVDAWATYHGDLWLDHSGDGFHPTPHVRLLATPGHSAQDVTWLVETDGGVMACTHAWGLADSKPEDDGYATDQRALAQSREQILRTADVVVPGHDAAFQTTARSSSVATVYLTQNLRNYHARLGGGAKAEAETAIFPPLSPGLPVWVCSILAAC